MWRDLRIPCRRSRRSILCSLRYSFCRCRRSYRTIIHQHNPYSHRYHSQPYIFHYKPNKWSKNYRSYNWPYTHHRLYSCRSSTSQIRSQNSHPQQCNLSNPRYIRCKFKQCHPRRNRGCRWYSLRPLCKHRSWRGNRCRLLQCRPRTFCHYTGYNP